MKNPNLTAVQVTLDPEFMRMMETVQTAINGSSRVKLSRAEVMRWCLERSYFSLKAQER